MGFTERPAYSDAQAVAHRLAEMYEAEEIDRAVAVYNEYVSPLVQRVTEQQLLPISEGVLAHERDDQEEAEEQQALLGDFIYEPEPEQILERLLPVYLETEVYRSLLESSASELGADDRDAQRLSNAGELIDSLTLDLNRARQAEITQRSWKWSPAPTRYPITAQTLTQTSSIVCGLLADGPARRKSSSLPARAASGCDCDRERLRARRQWRTSAQATGSSCGAGSAATRWRSAAASSSSC
jgi:hypothetical protein